MNEFLKEVTIDFLYFRGQNVLGMEGFLQVMLIIFLKTIINSSLFLYNCFYFLCIHLTTSHTLL